MDAAAGGRIYGNRAVIVGDAVTVGIGRRDNESGTSLYVFVSCDGYGIHRRLPENRGNQTQDKQNCKSVSQSPALSYIIH
jgi:hypothetical protein